MKWLLPRRNRRKAGLGAGSVIPYHKFDESSGQIYSETTAAIPTSDDRNWARDSRIVKGANYLDEEEYEGYIRRLGGERENLADHQKRLDGLKNSKIRGFKGSRSLQDAAIECILENIADITLEGVECLPISIVRRVWHAVITRCSMAFSIWSIFSNVLRQNAEFLDLLKYHEEIEYPNCPLEVYTNPLTSMSYDFITYLSITTAFPVPDLMKLPAVKNLGTLEIINTTGGEFFAVGDRLLRSWHLAAVEKGAFSVLRILRLWKHDGLTEKSLVYLTAFPALAVYDVRGCNFATDSRMKANLVGWKAILETNILGLLDKSCLDRADLMRTRLEIQYTTCSKTESGRLWDGARVNRIPRTDVPIFLAKRPVLQGSVDADRIHAHGSKKKAKGSYFEAPPHDGRLPESKAPLMPRSDPQTWDLAAYRSYARIGELRNDIDLIRAGVVLGDQATVGDQLINSIPMVSLRLGESPPWLETSSTGNGAKASTNSFGWAENPRLATSSLRGLAFIRIKLPLLPSQDSASTEDSLDIRNDISRELAERTSSSAKPPLARRKASMVVKNKKRKLDDVLNSFF